MGRSASSAHYKLQDVGGDGAQLDNAALGLLPIRIGCGMDKHPYKEKYVTSQCSPRFDCMNLDPSAADRGNMTLWPG